jgi:hypothetical protein
MCSQSPPRAADATASAGDGDPPAKDWGVGRSRGWRSGRRVAHSGVGQTRVCGAAPRRARQHTQGVSRLSPACCAGRPLQPWGLGWPLTVAGLLQPDAARWRVRTTRPVGWQDQGPERFGAAGGKATAGRARRSLRSSRCGCPRAVVRDAAVAAMLGGEGHLCGVQAWSCCCWERLGDAAARATGCWRVFRIRLQRCQSLSQEAALRVGPRSLPSD